MNVRLFLVSACLAAVATCHGQDQNLTKKVSINEPAARADRVLADLTKASGSKFFADDVMAKEVLILNVHDVTVYDLAKQIAKVASGTWEKQDGGYVLKPDNAKRAAEDQAYRSEQTAEAKAEIDKIKQKVSDEDNKKSTGNDSAAAFSGPNQEATRAIDKLLVQIDSSTIAGLAPHERVVFASSPTPMQLQLPAVDASDITALINQQNQTAAAVQKSVQTQSNPQINEFVNDLFGEYFKPISGTPAEAILIVAQTGGTFDAKVADLRLYDAKGNVLYTGRENLTPALGGFLDQAIGAASGKKPKPKEGPPEEKGAPIPFTDNDKLFMKASPGMANVAMGAPPTMPQVSAKLETFLRDPADYEPLSFVTSTAMMALASEKNEQLVGDLPDSLMGGVLTGGTRGLREGTTTAQYRRLLQKMDVVTLDEQTGWMDVVPKDPAKERDDRFDRPALTLLVEDTMKRHAPALDDLAGYALVSQEPKMDSLAGLYFIFGIPGAMNQILATGADWQTLRFYGSLRFNQKEALRNGQSLALQSLSPDQVECLRQMAFGNQANLKVSGTEPKNGESYFSRMMAIGMAMVLPSNQKTYLEEPTECMPNGLPNGLDLEENTELSATVRPAGATGLESIMGAMGPEEYGLYKMAGSQPQLASLPKLDKLYLGRRTTYHIRIQLLPNVYMTRNLIDDSFPENGEVVSSSDLPQDFMEKANKAADEMKRLIPTGNP